MTLTWMELRDARALKGWTQAQLADAVGVHVKTIVNWESKGVPPRSEYLVRRAMLPEVRYVEYATQARENGITPDGFEEFTEWSAREAAWSHEDDAADVPSEDEYEHAIDEAQTAYDEKVARLDSLASFTSDQLLGEVSRRIQQLERAVADVGTKDDYDLATRKAETESTDEQ